MSVENIRSYLSMMDEFTTMITLYSHTVRAQLKSAHFKIYDIGHKKTTTNYCKKWQKPEKK